MEYKFKKVRKQLDNLGYLQVLIPESLPLVEKLVADLIQTTESLQKYKKISKEVIEERDQLLLGAEPYKCDNAKLVKECNELHLTFLQIREQSEKIQKDLKRRLATAERETGDARLECEKLKKRIRDLQFECAKKGGKNSSGALKTRCKCSDRSSTMAMGDQRVSNLTKEVKKLKEEHSQLSEVNETYKTQLNNRDREIERLSQMLEGGRPIQVLSKECCYKEDEGRISRLQNEIYCLEKDKKALEMQLEESVSKQHEAMRRALNLASRNKKLEQELRDIDHMALAVEADCNNTVKMNAEKVNRMQQKIHDAVLQIQSLEREAGELKRDKQGLMGDVDSLKLEKRHLQSVLETALDDKKRLNDQINQFTVIEHDLNLEIDRLVQNSAIQKRKIAELECTLVAEKFDAVSERSDFRTKKRSSRSPSLTKKSPTKVPDQKTQLRSNSHTKFSINKKLPSRINKSKINDPVTNSLIITDDNFIIQQMSHKLKKPQKYFKVPKKKALDIKNNSKTSKKEKLEQPVSSSESIPVPRNSPDSPITFNETSSDCESERVIKRKGPPCCPSCYCTKLHPTGKVDKSRRPPRMYAGEDDASLFENTHRYSNQDNQAELRQKLNEREQIIASLQHENKVLAQEKHNLMTRLDTARIDDFDGSSLKTKLKRAERELDMLKADLVRLEEEKNASRQRLQSLTEKQSEEQVRLKKALRESEDQCRELENERRELMQGQGSRRATISAMENKCQELTEELNSYKRELTQQKAIYGQLKTLHAQTDQALIDSQSQILQLEAELGSTRSQSNSLEKEKNSYNREMSSLKSDVKAMKGNLAKIDLEKDSLLLSVDEKTEKVSMLEEQLKAKDSQIKQLSGSVSELKQQLSASLEMTNSKEQLLRNATSETDSLLQELEAAKRGKENATVENRRLQDDLAASTSDCKCARNEIEMCKRQIEELKMQLQQYVAEVKRFEDIMLNKEAERNELLDQFKSLSQEAFMLENNNHTLENEASQSKVQLSVTLDHVADLENKLTCQCNLVSDYENQISELRSRVASLESKLHNTIKQQERAETDLTTIRDLCMKLDKQKDNLMRELNEKDNQRSQLDRDVMKMRRESDALRNSLEQDRLSLENLEKLLTESRQEAVQVKLYNQELEVEMQSLKQKIEEMQSRLVSTSQQLDLYQDRALDYSEQNKQLRRELANERFLLARDGDSKRYPSL